jgi:hypothetical protein
MAKSLRPDGTRPCRCPVCDKSNFAYHRNVAQHIAMCRDAIHRDWRIKHGISADYRSMIEVQRMIGQILSLLPPSMCK